MTIQKDSLVILPTYNEAEAIRIMIPRLLTLLDKQTQILIVDDNSPDGTGDIADEYAKQNPDKIQVLHRSNKDGLGKAYIAAFAWAKEQEYKRVVEMDIDGSHPIETLNKLIEYSRNGADLVIGSRYAKGGKTEGWSKARWLLSRTANLYAGLILRIPVRDITAGYRVYTTKTLAQLPLDEIDARGYYFQVAMTIACYDAGMNITEAPITFREREVGYSKMSTNIVIEAMLKVTDAGLKRLFQPNTWRKTELQVVHEGL